MAESPPRNGAPAGDEQSDADADADQAPNERGAGAAGAPFKKRTTVMGLAPAPHLGGMSGSPGAIARAEAAARKQRLLSALVTPPGGTATPRSGGAAGAASSEPPPRETAKPPAVGVARPVTTTARPPILDAEIEEPAPKAGGRTPSAPSRAEVQAKPKFGTGTLMMTPTDLDLAAPMPESAEWEAAPVVSKPDVLSEPTMLIEPAHPRPPASAYAAQAPPHPQRQGAYGQPPPPQQPMQPPQHQHPIQHPPMPQPQHPAMQQHPQHPAMQQQMPPPSQYAPMSRASYHPGIEPPPTTERLLRPASLAPPGAAPTPTTTGNAAPAATALAIRPPEYGQAPTTHAISGALDPRLVLLAEPDSPRAVGFRALRDSLLSKNLPRVLAVTSVAPREGKTTCAINVALALAESPSTRVLLVDANFLEPELGAVFSVDRLTPVISPQPWLGSYVIGAITNAFHVAAIPRSAVKKNQRFEQHRFDALIDQLCRGNYDYLVVDTPALSASPAVSTMIGGADGVLFAVRAGGTTTGRELKRATEQLPPKKALGVALIDAK